MFLSLGSGTSVWVCDPRQVCTAATCFGLLTSVMSKMRTPRKRSGLAASPTPLVPQSARPLDVVGVEAVEISEEQVIAAEGQIGVRETEHVGEPRIGRRVWIGLGQVRVALRRRDGAARLLRIEKALGLEQC